MLTVSVNVVSNVLPSKDDARYTIIARDAVTTEHWVSRPLDREEYVRTMNKLDLSKAQIEQPIFTGLSTDFGGIGHGPAVFSRDVIERLGLTAMRPKNTIPLS